MQNGSGRPAFRASPLRQKMGSVANLVAGGWCHIANDHRRLV
jgi:hypothetical protein